MTLHVPIGTIRFQYSICAKVRRRISVEDLSEDVVMDIGCGHELNCCKAIMMQFPEVKALIAVDKESTVFESERFRNRIEFCVGDIQESLLILLLVLIDSSVTTGRLAG
ncbi:jhamt [Trichonephila clavata]|uniref:Jhamt n=1 Tax=Trichonephila clavata TaxID=2740835 RepID=A0A8X6LPK4_TRICU|nr:jhamt [Trichonephila clavata]